MKTNRLVMLPADDGKTMEPDNLGRLLGVRVVGQEIRKEGSWFRDEDKETNA